MTSTEAGPSNAPSICSSINLEQCTEYIHVRNGTDITKNLVQVDRSSLDLIARREIQSDFSMGFGPKQSTDRTL